MYKKPVPLRNTDHSDLRLKAVSDYSYARDELVSPIVVDEIADVAREYPIVFPVGGVLPVALMGVETGANAYISQEGRWLANYIPSHIRQYPLAITQINPQGKGSEEDGPRFVVLVDEESSLVSRTEGDPIFDSNGKVTGTAQQRMRLMEQLQERSGITQRLVKAIEEAGLLVERAIRIKREGEQDRQVTGVRVINESALNKLTNPAFNKLRASGALPLVYAALLSWANFRQGPIGRSHPLPQPSDPFANDTIRFN
jgi:hypothetical protein